MTQHSHSTSDLNAQPGSNGRNGHRERTPNASNQVQNLASGATTTQPHAQPTQTGAPESNQPQRQADEYGSSGARSGSSQDTLPIDPRTGEPRPPMAQPGYYPGYSTLSQQAFWDEATRNVVLDRVNNVPPIRYFTPEELPLMEAVVARVLPQDDRDAAHRIPIVNYIDDRLSSGRIDGYRYEGMPDDKTVHRLGLKGIEACAHHIYGKSFVDLTPHEQDYVLETIHDGRPPAGEEYWSQMSVRLFWMMLVQDCIEAYYAHPYAWDEIGFGGPAYPRGYMRLHGGEPEPWERKERRYEWAAPSGALSDKYVYIDQEDPLESQMSGKPNVPGQEGTH